MRDRSVVVYGRDDDQGRALFVTTALYNCVDALRGRTVRFIGVDSSDVETAAQVFAHDTGIRVEICPVDPHDDPVKAFENALLYVAVVFNDAGRVAAHKASAVGAKTLVAVQFPEKTAMTAEVACLLSAAHDPEILAGKLRNVMASAK
jgi:hypothetical protein